MNHHYIFAWQERSSLMIGLAHHLALQKGEVDIFPLDFSDHLVFFKEGQTHAYFSEKDISSWEEKSRLFLEKDYLKSYLHQSHGIRNNFYAQIAKIHAQKLDRFSSQELLHLFSAYYAAVLKIAGIYYASAPEGVFHLDRTLRKNLQRHYSKEEIEGMYNLICSPYEFDITQKELIDWHEIIAHKQKSPSVFLAHAQKYPAFFFNTYSLEQVVDYLELRYKNQDLDELEKEVADLFSAREERKRLKAEICHQLPKSIHLLADSLAALAVDRFELKNCWSGAELLALPLFQEIAERNKIALEDLFSAYTAEDIEGLLKKGEALPTEEILNRRQGFFFRIHNKKGIFQTGPEALNTIEETFYKHRVLTEEVSGLTANSGTISGRANVVLVEDIKSFMKASKNFKEGDILVTTMTSPNMVLLMKQASGIVTNEGGVCSHAAVISREMKVPRQKPCIVGTKDATRVFKTGDYILIEGEKGTVRKIDKKFHDTHIHRFEKELDARSQMKKRAKSNPTYRTITKKNILFLEEIMKEDLLSVGGKGANLGEMFSHFPVPNAFCMTTHFYKSFFKGMKKELKKILSTMDFQNVAELQKKADRLQVLVKEQPFSKSLEKEICSAFQKLSQGQTIQVAVRSSATAEDLPEASFAGQQDTFLEIETVDQILLCIKECFASLYNSRAILYRKENHIDELHIGMSVVVQVMVHAEVAGVAFSVNPVTENQNEIIIDAAPGLGENVVSGKVTPDHYVYNRITQHLDIKAAKNAPVLKTSQIKELIKVILKIEKHYQYPQDIEWAFDQTGKLFILQSRPITTLSHF